MLNWIVILLLWMKQVKLITSLKLIGNASVKKFVLKKK